MSSDIWFKLFLWVAIAAGLYGWWVTRDTFLLVCNGLIAVSVLVLQYLDHKREQRNRRVARLIAVNKVLEQYQAGGV